MEQLRITDINTITKRIRFAIEVPKMRQVKLIQKIEISKRAFIPSLSVGYNSKQDKRKLIADALGININHLLGMNNCTYKL